MRLDISRIIEEKIEMFGACRSPDRRGLASRPQLSLGTADSPLERIRA
jgi:hypothetical protein